MTKDELKWTHENVEIIDIRKNKKVYVISIKEDYKLGDRFFDKKISPLFIKDSIFEERIESYFLKDNANISRKEILAVKWNMYITKGYFIKIEEGNIIKRNMDPEKWYVSYLEIAGSLGSFDSVLSSTCHVK